ncbi:tail fiber assembly protein [Citrobacter cronae]|uniref:tail fiber assembly protein n=1 Tax=Citrobacter cronae TaxID=1748967 RepID=UPI0021D22724|nr:tail fiber assembly protein [Citrobacter cronae]MCU6199128.1 tail fiber assembly protein [Citrobacter cronae]
MQRIDTSTAQKDKFGTGKNGFTNGNPQTGTPATDLDSAFFDSVQEELCNAIEKAGLTLDPNDNSQLWQVLSTGIGKYLAIKNNLSEIATAGADAQTESRENIGCGTASALDATTSITDSTVGHVLKVGDHGVGNDALLVVDTALSSAAGCPSGFFKQSGNDTDNRYSGYGVGANLQYAVTEDEGTYYGRVFVRHDGHLIAEWLHVNTDGTIAEQYVNELYGALNKPTATDTGALPIAGGDLLGRLCFLFQDARTDTNCTIGNITANGVQACIYGYYQDRFDIHFYDDEGDWESNPVSISRNGNCNFINVFDNGQRVFSPNNPQDMSAYMTSTTANGKFVTGVRFGANMSTSWGADGGTAPAGCALTGGDFNDSNAYPYYAYLQYCINGTWINATGGVGAEQLVSANHYQPVSDGTISLLTNLRPYLRESDHILGLVGAQHYIDDNGHDWFEAAPKLAGAVFIAVVPDSGVIVQIADSSLPETDVFSLYPDGVTVAGLDSLPSGCTIDGTWKFDSESRTVSQDADLVAARALTKNTQMRTQYAATAALNIATLQAGIDGDRSVDGDSALLTSWQNYLCDLRAMTPTDLQQSPAVFPDAPVSVF